MIILCKKKEQTTPNSSHVEPIMRVEPMMRHSSACVPSSTLPQSRCRALHVHYRHNDSDNDDGVMHWLNFQEFRKVSSTIFSSSLLLKDPGVHWWGRLGKKGFFSFPPTLCAGVEMCFLADFCS